MAEKTARELESKAGIPAERRGQQEGDSKSASNMPSQSRVDKNEETPALRGNRVGTNKMFSDESTQHVGTNSAQRRDNTPSVPGAMLTGESVHESEGEKVFKRRQDK